jgi:hypothetical protein
MPYSALGLGLGLQLLDPVADLDRALQEALQAHLLLQLPLVLQSLAQI